MYGSQNFASHMPPDRPWPFHGQRPVEAQLTTAARMLTPSQPLTSGFRTRIQSLGLRVQGLRFRIQGFRFKVQSLGFHSRVFRAWNWGLRVSCVGFWAWGVPGLPCQQLPRFSEDTVHGLAPVQFSNYPTYWILWACMVWFVRASRFWAWGGLDCTYTSPKVWAFWCVWIRIGKCRRRVRASDCVFCISKVIGWGSAVSEFGVFTCSVGFRLSFLIPKQGPGW